MDFTEVVYYLNTEMNVYFNIISLGIMLLIIYNEKIENRFVRLLCINNEKLKK